METQEQSKTATPPSASAKNQKLVYLVFGICVGSLYNSIASVIEVNHAPQHNQKKEDCPTFLRAFSTNGTAAVANSLHEQDGKKDPSEEEENSAVIGATATIASEPRVSISLHALIPPAGFVERAINNEWDNTANRFHWAAEAEKRTCVPNVSFSFEFVRTTRTSSSSNESALPVRNVEWYMGAPLGNALCKYYNDRALAYIQNEIFTVNATSMQPMKGMANCFPTIAFPQKSPYWKQLKGIRNHLNDIDLRPHAYPHVVSSATMNLIPKLISEEVHSVAQAWSKLTPFHEADAPGKNTLVMHLRCDNYILKLHNEYGVLPHRYFLDRVTNETKEIVVVRKQEGGENACTWSLNDFIEEASKIVPTSVRQSTDPTMDWLYLTQASTLICAPSSFCLTAGWGNPNTVYFPTGGGKAAIAVPDAKLVEISQKYNMYRPSFRWIPMDFLPGKVANGMDKKSVLSYVRSSKCDPDKHGCIPA